MIFVLTYCFIRKIGGLMVLFIGRIKICVTAYGTSDPLLSAYVMLKEDFKGVATLNLIAFE